MPTFTVIADPTQRRDLKVLDFTEVPEQEVEPEPGVSNVLGRRDPVVVSGESRLEPAHGTFTIDVREMDDWKWIMARLNGRDVLSVENVTTPLRITWVEHKITENAEDGGLTTVAEVYKWVAASS